jgi:hypothetical protein
MQSQPIKPGEADIACSGETARHYQPIDREFGYGGNDLLNGCKGRIDGVPARRSKSVPVG